MKANSLVGLMICLVGAAPVRGDDLKLVFQKVSLATGRFKVEMPGRPELKSTEIAGGYKHVKLKVPVSDVLNFSVQYVDLKERDVKKKTPQEGIKAYRSGWRKGAEIQGDREISTGHRRVPGREYQFEIDKGGYVRERLFQDGVRIYILYVFSTEKAFLNSKDADRFFNSFMITD